MAVITRSSPRRGGRNGGGSESFFSTGLIIKVLAVTVIVGALLNTALITSEVSNATSLASTLSDMQQQKQSQQQQQQKQRQQSYSSNTQSKTKQAPFSNENDAYLNKKYDVCMVGAGLSGSVLAERYASELKASVLVLEKRFHIGGNCYDYIDEETGIRVSLYGAHLFHTKYDQVKSYVQNFGRWIPYTHKVRGIVNGKNVPIPVNIETVNTLFDLNIQNANQMDEWLKKEQVPLPPGQQGVAENSEQVALSRVGKRLYDLMFRPYTYKQWAKYPVELGPEVLSRIPVRNNNDERYFNDPFQALPANGYTSIFHQMLSSPLITVKTNVDYFEIKDRLQCDKLYFSGPIDAYFADQGWPKLEYRSLDFERVVEKNKDALQSHFVVNHPQDNVDFTRIVEYKHLPYYTDDPENDKTGKLRTSPHTIYFKERSKDDGEPYYPVPNEKNKALYAKYQALAEKELDVTFVGRLANYKYFNMDEAIKNALELFEKDTGIPYEAGGTVFSHESIMGKSAQTNPGQSAGQGELVSFSETLPKDSAYSNLPPIEYTQELQDQVARALALPVAKPVGLRHEAHPPGKNAVMGLAAYPRNMGTFRLLVGSLRHNGYDGHIILGVHKDIPPEEEEYLKAMDVTYYITAFVDCDPSIMDAGEGGGAIRGKCSEGLEKLKLEWGRFEMCRQWLHACKECTGWTLVMDTRDIFFQADPFASLPDPDETNPPQHDLLLIEEIAPHSNPRPDQPYRADILGQSRYVARTDPCYGRQHYLKYFNRPVLCSGTIVGTRQGMHRFLSVLVDEFLQNNQKTNLMCRSPHNTDQWTMDYLYYNGRFGEFNRTKTMPYGTGPINTIGTPCINRRLPSKNRHSQKDLILFENGMTGENDTTTPYGLILNIHEPADSKARIAPAVHQYDRCSLWINKFLRQHPELSQKDAHGRYIPVDQLKLPYEKTTTS